MVRHPNISTIGIIGGTGLLGQWLKRFFERQGYDILVAGRKTTLTFEECASKSDVVIVSVPIARTEEVIERIGKYVRDDALLMDMTSIKKGPVKSMLANSKSAVIGVHPLFGPRVETMKNQTVVVCPARPKDYLSWLTGVFRKEGAKVQELSPQEHDEAMAIIQGLMHFSSISLCHSLGTIGKPMGEMEQLSSPIFRFAMDTVGRILNQDASLYADIELSNPLVVPILKSYIIDAQKLLAIIEKNDKQAFEEYFREAADYLGDFKQEAEYYTDLVIQFLVDRGKRK